MTEDPNTHDDDTDDDLDDDLDDVDDETGTTTKAEAASAARRP
jgi:hypothetical protein